jgi:PAS domain S-box-containing protein
MLLYVSFKCPKLTTILKKSFLISLFIFLLSSYSCSNDKSFSNQNSENEIVVQKKQEIDNFICNSEIIKDTSVTLWLDLSIKYLKISREINYSRGEGFTLINIGLYNTFKNQYVISLDYLHKALDIAEKANDLFVKSNAQKSIGILFMYLKSNDQSLKYFNLSLHSSFLSKDTSNIIESTLGIGQIYQEMKENNKAYTQLFYALYLATVYNKTRPIEFSYKTIGIFFLNQNKLIQAKYYFSKLESIYLKNGKNLDLSSLYTIYAHINQLEDDNRSALKNNLKAKRIREKETNKELYSSSLINIGNCYLKMKKYDSAEYFLDAGLKIAKDSNNNHVMQYGYNKLCKLYLAQKNYKNALDNLSLAIISQDSLNLEKNRSDISIYEAKQTIYEGEKKIEIVNAENQAQKLRIKYNNIQILFLVSFSILLFGIVLYVHRQYIRNKRSKLALERLNRQLDSEIEERKLVELQLRKSEELHRFLTDHSMDVISRVDNNYRYVYISPSCKNTYGYTKEEMMQHGDIFFRNDVPSQLGIRATFSEMLKTQGPIKFTYQIRKKDGTMFWVESHLNPIYDEESGEFKELISVSRDISDRVRYEESLIENARQKELLMKEIHHRAKNNFAILISLLNIQKYQTNDPELFATLNELQSRIRTMVLIHEQLHRSNSLDTVSFGTYIRNLSNIISSAFRKEGILLHMDIADCQLNIETALPLGLIVNELLTNSFKYAFHGREKGIIHIRLVQVPEPEDGKIMWELIIEDDGVGLPDDFALGKEGSMGSLIIQALVDQIQGEIQISGNAGASFRIIFPGAPVNPELAI